MLDQAPDEAARYVAIAKARADDKKIVDSLLGASTWSRGEPDAAVGQLIEAQLSQAIEALE